MIGEIQQDLEKELQEAAEREEREIFKQEMSLKTKRSDSFKVAPSPERKRKDRDLKESLEVFMDTMKLMRVVVNQRGTECLGCVYFYDEVKNVARLLIDQLPLYSLSDQITNGLV